MGQIVIQMNGRNYRLGCGDGEEQRARRLADHIRRKIEGLVRAHGQIGDDRLLLMAAMMISDELFDAREKILEMEATASDINTDASVEPVSPPKIASA